MAAPDLTQSHRREPPFLVRGLAWPSGDEDLLALHGFTVLRNVMNPHLIQVKSSEQVYSWTIHGSWTRQFPEHSVFVLLPGIEPFFSSCLQRVLVKSWSKAPSQSLEKVWESVESHSQATLLSTSLPKFWSAFDRIWRSSQRISSKKSRPSAVGWNSLCPKTNQGQHGFVGPPHKVGFDSGRRGWCRSVHGVSTQESYGCCHQHLLKILLNPF